MSDREEKGKEVTDRLAGRFQEPEPDESGGSGEQSESAERSERAERVEQSQQDVPDENDESGESSENDLNVKEDWKGRYMYIPPSIHKRFDDEYERLRYECGRDLGWKPKKNQHYYPVVATEGVDAVAEMGPNDFLESVTGFEYFDEQDLRTTE